jgi:hypothetical protein
MRGCSGGFAGATPVDLVAGDGQSGVPSQASSSLGHCICCGGCDEWWRPEVDLNSHPYPSQLWPLVIWQHCWGLAQSSSARLGGDTSGFKSGRRDCR